MTRQVISLRAGNMREENLSPLETDEAKSLGFGGEALAHHNKIIKLFETHLRGHRLLLQGSIDTAMSNVGRFARYVQRPIWLWEPSDLTNFIDSKIQQSDISVSTQAIYFTYLRMLQNWLFNNQGLLNEIHHKFGVQPQRWIDQTNAIPVRRRGRKSKKDKTALSGEEFVRVMKEFDDQIALAFATGSKSAYPLARDKVMVTVEYEYGLRVSELCDLRLDQFMPDNKYPQFGKYAILALIGKGRVDAAVHALDPKIADVLNWYETWIRPHFMTEKTTDTGLYFYSERGGKLVDEQVRRRLKDVTAKAGITKRITPHSLRRTNCTDSIALLGPIGTQKQLRHSSIDTTFRSYYCPEPESYGNGIANAIAASVENDMDNDL